MSKYEKRLNQVEAYLIDECTAAWGALTNSLVDICLWISNNGQAEQQAALEEWARKCSLGELATAEQDLLSNVPWWMVKNVFAAAEISSKHPRELRDKVLARRLAIRKAQERRQNFAAQ